MTDKTKARAQILEGFCPWCGAGPFKVPASHISRVHDLNRFQLRDELGFFYQDSLTDPDYHQMRSERGRQQFLAGKSGIGGSRRGTTKTLSKAAIQMQKQKSHLVSDETRRRIAQEAGQRRLAEARPRDDLIIKLASEGRTNTQIAEETGVWPQTVEIVLRRNGQPPTARKRYAEARRGTLPAGLVYGSELQRLRSEADAHQLIARYLAGTSLNDLAGARGISLKALKARFKRYGMEVPDGRSDPNRKKGVRPKRPPRFCEMDGCTNQHRAQGLCGMHYQRLKAQDRKGRT